MSSPIFIVGSEHSGTSILLAILSSHNHIYAVPYESGMALKRFKKFKEAAGIFDRHTIAESKRRWVEKTPRHICCLSQILSWQPNARILLITRDGLDVAYSIKKRTHDLIEGANLWLAYNQAAKPYWSHPQVHRLKYEDLVADFENCIKDVLAFLDEPYQAELANYWKTPRKYYAKSLEKPASQSGDDHNHFRNWQINQPLFDGRGQWRGKLTDQEVIEVMRICDQMQRELGYISEEG